MISSREKILVIAPHPDDEVLGCGGTIRSLTKTGATVHLCIVTEAYTPEWSKEFISKRPGEVKRAAKILGVKEVHFLGFPTVALDTVPQKELNERMGELIEKIQPDTIYIPHRGDLNIDHRLVHEAALVAARPGHSRVKTILAYETLSETEWGVVPFSPNVYRDITKTIKEKMAAMCVYASEVKDFPHSRSLLAIEALAMKRGSEVQIKRAEAFMLVRSLESH